jgi:hypothetical protein
METQIYLKVYSATGVVRKADAKKMTNLYYHDLKNGIVVIPVVSEEIAHLYLKHKILNKKYTKHYNFIIEKKYITSNKQLVTTKLLDHGSIN